MRQSRWMVLLLVVLLGIALMFGCAPEVEDPEDPEEPEEPAEEPVTEEVPAVGGEMVYGMTAEPVILNTILSTGTPAGFVNGRVYVGLVRADENLEMQPYAARDWEFSDDGLEWTFELRDDVYFHDGVQLTADDVVYTYMAILHPDYTGHRRPTYRSIEDVVAVDDFTVKFILSEPFAPLLSNLTLGILPAHLFEDQPIGEMRELEVNMQPIGAGPYVFEEWRSGEYMVLTRNPDFFLDGPYIEQVRIRFYGDEQVMLTALEAGDIDYMGSIPPDDIERVVQEHADRFNFIERQQNGYSYIGLKQTDARLSDLRVRQAMTYGIDRQGIVDAVLGGYGTVMNANIPPFSWAYNPDLEPYEYNPDKAVQLLEDAGWTDIGDDGIRRNAEGERLSVECVTNAGNIIRESSLLIAQDNLSEIGFELKPEFYEWSVLLDQYLDVAMFESYLLGWGLGLDPDAYLFFHSEAGVDEQGNLVGFNDVEYDNSRVDELLELGRTTMDHDARVEIYREIQELLNEELPYVFLYSQDLVTAMAKHVEGVTMSDIGPLFPEEWYVETETITK